MADQVIQVNMTRIHLMIATLVLIGSLLTPFITGFIAISKNTETLYNHDKRILILEAEDSGNHDLLLEIKFNLKKHMNDSGEIYVDMGDRLSGKK